jgi:uncharacterized membrane protein YeaQ/YmgE (transglycosylase-associated protein family)
MDLITLLVQAVSGGVGGNIAPLLNKAKSLGPLLNTVLGVIGGVGGGQALAGTVGGGTIGTVGTSAVVGLVLPLIGSFLKKKA